MKQIAERAPQYRDDLAGLREIFLANVVMAGEIPSPTGRENGLVQFLHDRFTEAGLHSIPIDEAGNCAAILYGKQNANRNILVAAHVDKIWSPTEDHTVRVSESNLTGRGVADNSLGVAALATLPLILQQLEVELNSNLILLGTTKSFGAGDLGGIRFFLEHTQLDIAAGLCLEGIELGRLSYSSLGMIRGEIEVQLERKDDWPWHGQGAGAIRPLNKIIESIMRIERPEQPRTSILLGSVGAGSGYSVPPREGILRFEVRSESEQVVDRIYQEIQEIVEETVAQEQGTANLRVLARRYPGDIGFKHPLVKSVREIMEALDVKPRMAPSISELSALLDRGIPALTLGITTGENRSTPNETINIGPVFTGLAQIVTTLQSYDQFLEK